MKHTVRSNMHLVGNHQQIRPSTGDNSLRNNRNFARVW